MMKNVFTVNMSVRNNVGGFDILVSKKFNTKAKAVKAMRRMRKYGFKRSLTESHKAKYSIVTYTRYGDVVECEDYSKVHNSDIEVVGKSLSYTQRRVYKKCVDCLPEEDTFNITMTMTPDDSEPQDLTKGVFSKYTLEEYGKGYLVHPPRGDMNWGMKYFYIQGGCGWWNAKQNGWFFQAKYLPFLLENGVKTGLSEHAMEVDEEHSISKSTQVHFSPSAPRRSRRLNGASSFTEAKLNETCKRKRFERLNRLADELVKRKRRSIVSDKYESDEDEEYVPDVEESEEEVHESPEASESDLFFNYTLRPYKRGFLLIPEKGDENWGEKYFHDGWWMPSQDAWFFRPQFYDFLIENGARSVSAPLDTPPSKDLILENSFGWRLIKYKKGVVLTVPKSDPSYGESYYFNESMSPNRGWWNKNAKGWFFKRQMTDTIREHMVEAEL